MAPRIPLAGSSAYLTVVMLAHTADGKDGCPTSPCPLSRTNPVPANTRLDTVVQRISSAVEILDILSNNLGAPFVDVICATTRALITSAQNIKRNKNECAELLESTHQLLQAILALHIKADTKADVPAATLSPSALNHLGKFVETLHKLHHFIEAQQDRRQLRQFLTFRQGETAVFLKECRAGLQAALDFFLLERSDLLNAICELQRDEQNSHEKLLLLLNFFYGRWTFWIGCSVFGFVQLLASANLFPSSQSFSMLPSRPKIFHGRENEITAILSIFSFNASPRITILGAGGDGQNESRQINPPPSGHLQTFCGTQALHPLRYSVHQIELAALLADHLEVKSAMKARDRTRVVVKYLRESPPTLLVLDNLETVWEPQESRADVTMRGAERPAQVQWTRPFLPILKPLSDEAAHQTFIDIADDIHIDDSDLRTILDLTNKMPLADEGGCSAVLARWDHETNVPPLLRHRQEVQSGHVHSAIALQPKDDVAARSASVAQSFEHTSRRPLRHRPTQSNASLLSCKSALLRTSLAYIDDHARLQVLIPIREYMHRLYSPSEPLIDPLRRHFQALLDVYQTYRGTVSQTAVLARISSDFGNIQSTRPVVAAAISSACKVLPTLNTVDHQLKAVFYTRFLNTWRVPSHRRSRSAHPTDPGACEHFDDTGIKSRLYLAIGGGNTKRKCDCLDADCKRALDGGRYPAGRKDAAEAQELATSIADPLPRGTRSCWPYAGFANGEVDHAIFGTPRGGMKDKSEYTETIRSDHALAMLNVAEVDVHMGAPREESAIGYMKGGPICDMLREGAYEKAKLLLSRRDGEIVTYCLERLGNSERWAADWPDSWTFVFLAHVLKSEETLGILKALQYLGDIFLAQGDATTAGSLYRVALDGFTRMDVHRGRAEYLVNAETLWRDALPLLQTSSQEKTLQGVRARGRLRLRIGDSAPNPPLSVPQLA
ncbi:hypothetical protein C8F01DRAFT_1185895 [Mycena amicta]|nr:hypothetical protein C8F01DRAFT_1185895 [Mycena amicta]